MDKIYCILHSIMFCSDPIFLNRSGTIAFLKIRTRQKCLDAYTKLCLTNFNRQTPKSAILISLLHLATLLVVTKDNTLTHIVDATKVHGLISPRGQMINLFLYFPRRNLFFSRDIANKIILFSG